MNPRIVRVLCGGLLFFSSAPASPEEVRAGAIAGLVRSAVTGQPLAGIELTIEGSSARAESDVLGRFRIGGLAIGTHELVASGDRYLVCRQPDVVVGVGRETEVAIELHERINVGEQVQVAAAYFARPDDVATGSFVMSREEVRRAPGALGDVSRILQTLPGLAPRDDLRNDIVSRGGSPGENLTLVDGFEIPSINHFAAFGASGGNISMLDAELVNDASFIAGGFPAPYGDRLSSVLDVRLRDGSRERYQGMAEVGLAGAGAIVEGPLGRCGSFLASVRRSYMELIAGAFGVQSVPVYANFLGRASCEVDPRHTLTFVTVGGSDANTDDVPLGDLDNPDMMKDVYKARRGMAGLRLRSVLGSHAVGTFSLGASLSSYAIDTWDKGLSMQQVEHNRSRETQTSARYELVYQLKGLQVLRLGAYAKRLDSHFDLAWPLGLENPYSAERERMSPIAIDRRGAWWQLGGYTDFTFPLLRRVALTLGGRLDRYGPDAATRFSPRAGLVVHATKSLELSASAGHYEQLPPLALLQATPENAALRPMQADHYVAGIAFLPRPDLKISIEGYRKTYARYPVSADVPSLTLASFGEQYDASFLMPMESRGQGRAWGVDFFVQKKLTGSLWGITSYAWSHSDQRALDGVWRPSSFDMPHILSLAAGYRIRKGFEASTKLTACSGRPYTPYLPAESAAQNREVLDTERTNALRAPAYLRWDLRLDKRFAFRWGGLALFVEAENLTNRKNVRSFTWNPKKRQVQAVEQLPLMAMGGVNVEF